jgi:hypothetical protein
MAGKVHSTLNQDKTIQKIRSRESQAPSGRLPATARHAPRLMILRRAADPAPHVPQRFSRAAM